jgi:N-acylneuraminate cytidylyltransferase
MKRIAIIPARGGSKRIPKKNIKNFCGRPIISYVLEAARDSNLFDVIHVSTDSREIADLVERLGFPINFMRVNELSDDYTPIMPVLKWVLEQYKDRGLEFDVVTTIMPCAPFVEKNDLISASKLLKAGNYKNPVLSVSAYSAPIEWAFNKGKNSLLSPIQKDMLEKRSQDLTEHYFDTGSFAFFSSEHINSSIEDDSDMSYLGYVIDKYKAIDIDNMEDWQYAELTMYGLLNNCR